MSSLLRSTKFVRYFCGAARTLILNSAKNVETNLLINSNKLCAANNIIVRDYASTKKTESLEPLLQHMDSEMRRNGRVSKRYLDNLFDEIKSKRDISSSQSLLVIRCCGDILSEELPEKRTLLVQKIWSVLTDIGVPMDISHYNTLLRVYIENEHPFSPAEFLEELQNKGLQANQVTYQRLMWQYCQQGDIEGATKLLESMRELGLPITVPVLNALVMGHSNLGDTDGAKSVLNTVTSAGLQATNHTYALLACGYAKNGDLEGVESVLKTANDTDVLMTNKDIFTIIEAFARNGHEDKLDPMFEHIVQGASYRHDAQNCILSLINKGCDNAAIKILKTFAKPKETDQKFYQGAFFVKQLLKANRSPQQLLQICRELQKDELIPNALIIALEGSLQEGNVELSQLLLKELKAKGTELRQHYFWPLLAQKGKENDEEGLLQILRSMSNEGFMISRETLQNYVIPYLQRYSDPQNVIVKLQIATIPTMVSAKCVLIELLLQGKIVQAADIAQEYKIKGNAFIKEPLVSALNKTKDIDSFTRILQVTSARNDISQTDEALSQDENQVNRNAVEVDEIVKRAVKALKAQNLCENLLMSLLSKGVGISPKTAEDIEQILGQQMTPSLSDTLTKLSTSDLEISPVQKLQPTSRSAVKLEHLISTLKEKGNEVHGLKKQLLVAYMKENQMEKVESFVKELETDGFVFTSTTLAQLMDFYCANNDAEKAMHYKELLLKNYPDYKIYNLKMMQLAHVLIKSNKVDEAIKMFKDGSPDGSNHFMYNTKCWQVLNELAEQKNVEKLNELFNILHDKNYIEPSNILLGPLIKVHLLRDEFDLALKQFEHCCKQYRSTPWKGELMKHLIVAEDASKLQWLADLSTQIHGEVNVLYDLILAFVECGRLRQARRILETPGLHTRNQRLDAACKIYVKGGNTECIEGLLEATKELSHIDRSQIFYHLLTSYCKADDTDKALGLWNLLQEEGEVPSEAFLTQLGTHLQAKNRPVPFVIPTPEKPKKKTETDQTKPTQATAQTKKSQISKEVDELISGNNINKAFNITLNSLKEGGHIDKKVAAFLLKNLAESGSVQEILALKPYYETEKKPINYHHKLSLATVLNGSGPQMLDNIEVSLNNAKNEQEYENVLRQFPRADALNILLKDDELAKKCESIAESLASKGFTLPIHMLWMEYIINNQKSNADALWQRHLLQSTFIKFKRLVQYAYENQRHDIFETLISYLKTNKHVTPEAIGNVYSRQINLYLNQNNLEKAKEFVEKARADGLSLNNITKSTWTRFQKVSESNGESFTYNVPVKSK